jgi:spore maturation protein CgeB
MLDAQIILQYVTDVGSRRAVEAAADLPTAYARDGLPTLTWKGARLHSAVNPRSEFVRTFPELEACSVLPPTSETVHVLLLAPGLGYAIKALDRELRLNFPAHQFVITCVEADAEIARKALQLRLWEPVQTPVRFVVPSDGEQCPELTVAVSRAAIVVRSTPGYRLQSPFYEATLRTRCTRTQPSAPLRILVPTPVYGGSVPIAGYCASALRELGHEVELFDLTAYAEMLNAPQKITADSKHRTALQTLLSTYLGELIVARAAEIQADLVWAVAQTPLMPMALLELRELKIATALWFVEDYQTLTYWRQVASEYDAVFTIQRGPFLEELKQCGVTHAHYLPLAADPRVHKPLTLTQQDQQRYGSATSFVGAGYPNRQHLFERVALPDFALWGNDWPAQSVYSRYGRSDGKRVSTEECVRIYNATTINVNLHSSNRHDGVNPHGDFVNPRTFEIAACGAFQVVDHRSELAELFDLEQEMVTFSDDGELTAAIEHYLNNPERRAQVAARARARVLKDHTYVTRMKSALAQLTEVGVLVPARDNPNRIARLKEAAAGDEELLQFLSQFADNDTVTLDDIATKILEGSGDLSPPEALFMMMREFRDWGRVRGVIQ